MAKLAELFCSISKLFGSLSGNSKMDWLTSVWLQSSERWFRAREGKDNDDRAAQGQVSHLQEVPRNHWMDLCKFNSWNLNSPAGLCLRVKRKIQRRQVHHRERLHDQKSEFKIHIWRGWKDRRERWRTVWRGDRLGGWLYCQDTAIDSPWRERGGRETDCHRQDHLEEHQQSQFNPDQVPSSRIGHDCAMKTKKRKAPQTQAATALQLWPACT